MSNIIIEKKYNHTDTYHCIEYHVTFPNGEKIICIYNYENEKESDKNIIIDVQKDWLKKIGVGVTFKYDNVAVKKSSGAWGISSHEYDVEFPDGDKDSFWSPVWNDYDEEEELIEASKYALGLWDIEKRGKE